MSDPDQRGKSSGRLFKVGLLALLVALVVAYLRDCIPGLGSGGSSAPSETAPAKATPPVEKSDAPASAIVITVEGDRCRKGGAPLEPCADVCASVKVEPPERVEVAAALGTHAAVETLKACLQEAGVRDVLVRTD